MQIAAETATRQSLQSLHGDMLSEVSITAPQSQFQLYRVIRRNGAVQGQDPISMVVSRTSLVRSRFDGRVAASVLPDNVLEHRAFGGRGGVEWSCGAASRMAAATVVWDNGVRLNPDLLCQDLLPGSPGEEFGSSGLALTAE